VAGRASCDADKQGRAVEESSANSGDQHKENSSGTHWHNLKQQAPTYQGGRFMSGGSVFGVGARGDGHNINSVTVMALTVRL
jgi:hypothetical protein